MASVTRQKGRTIWQMELETGEQQACLVTFHLSARPASAQGKGSPPRGGSHAYAYRCCRKLVKPLGCFGSPSSAPRPRPQECRWRLPHTPPATPPVGAAGVSVPALP